MGTYAWITLSSPSDLSLLKTVISGEYDPETVADKLGKGLSGAVKAILVEFGYVDKDYRSTYYNFYSKKGRRYRMDCVRLHFFDQTVTFEEKAYRLACADSRLTDHYFGYMILRPTGIATIGRTVLSPDIRSGAARYIITSDHKIHILGYRLTVEGFPSMDQHIDIAVCAHVACWSILRHYSERYSIYREYLTHDITRMAQQFDPGGLVPSLGLDISDAERVFQKAETFPLQVPRDTTKPSDPIFYHQLISYVESGFPLFAAMQKKEHAIAVVGYEWRPPVRTATTGMSYAWDEVKTLAVVDDNRLPYFSIPVAAGSSPYSAEDIDAFIVALPEKVYYPATAVDHLAPALFTLGLAGMPAIDETIVRYFITTGSAFRRFVRERETEYDSKLIESIMDLPLAQFVWVVEFATRTQWEVGQITARALIDATASARENMPLWLFHGCTQALIYERQADSFDPSKNFHTLSMPDVGRTGFGRMAQNLRPTQTK